jgi:hypothetical protein
MSKGRKQAPQAAARSDEPQAAVSFELGYTEDAATEIRKLDGSVKNSFERSWRKNWLSILKAMDYPCAGRSRVTGSTNSQHIA